LRQESTAQQDGDLVRVEFVILGLAAVNGFHGQGMPEHERDVFGRTEIREPVPREHALGRDDEIGTVRRDRLEECGRGGGPVPVHEHLAGGVEDAHVHRLHMQIDPAVILVLVIVESHRSSSCARVRIHPASAYSQ